MSGAVKMGEAGQGEGTVFLTRAEAAALLRKSPDTIDSLRKSGRLIEGVHYFRPRGSRPLYSRQALIEWVCGSARLLNSSNNRRGPRINMGLLG